MRKYTKFNLDTSYKQYTKNISKYGINPMSKKEFENIVTKVNIRSPRKDKKGKTNINIKLGKEAVKEQIEGLSGYDKYVAMWRKAKKSGFIKATTPMSRETFIKEKQLLGNVKEGTKILVQQAYQTDKRQVEPLLAEARLLGLKITRFDLYKQNQKYKDFLKIINTRKKDGSRGWITFESFDYNDLKYAGATKEEMGPLDDLEYDEENDVYVTQGL